MPTQWDPKLINEMVQNTMLMQHYYTEALGPHRELCSLEKSKISKEYPNPSLYVKMKLILDGLYRRRAIGSYIYYYGRDVKKSLVMLRQLQKLTNCNSSEENKYSL